MSLLDRGVRYFSAHFTGDYESQIQKNDTFRPV